MATRTSRDRTARQRAAIATRRANARRSEPVPATPRRGRAWIVGVTLAAIVLAAVVVVALTRGGGSSTAPPSSELTATLVEGASGPLPIDAAPAAYTLTYDLRSSDVQPPGSDTVAPSDRTYSDSTERFRVQRPFRTHIDSTVGTAPGEVQWSIVSDLGRSSSTSTGSESATVETITPSAGIGDWRLDAVLADLVADHSFVLRERRSLLGRECQVYRTGSPLENYQITAPTDTTYADVCIDGAGLVLEQVAVAGGTATEHLTATAVDTAPTLTDDDFAIVGEPVALGDGGMRLDPIGGPPADASYWGFASPPSGYTLQGRYTLSQNATDQSTISPNGGGGGGGGAGTCGGTGTSTPLGATTVVISYVDVYTDGPNVVVVLQGPTSVEPSDDNPGSDATSAALGKVTIESKLTGSQLVGHPAATPDWFVQVSGTVPRAALLTMTDALRQQSATTG